MYLVRPPVCPALSITKMIFLREFLLTIKKASKSTLTADGPETITRLDAVCGIYLHGKGLYSAKICNTLPFQMLDTMRPTGQHEAIYLFSSFLVKLQILPLASLTTFLGGILGAKKALFDKRADSRLLISN